MKKYIPWALLVVALVTLGVREHQDRAQLNAMQALFEQASKQSGHKLGAVQPITWAGDMAGSTLQAQYVASISGNANGGGSIPLNGVTALQTSSGVSALSIGTNKSGATLTMQAGVAQSALTLADSGSLGPFPTTGTLRVPNNFSLVTRNAGNTLDINVISVDTSANINIGQAAGTGPANMQIQANNLLLYAGTGASYFDAGPIHFRNHAHSSDLVIDSDTSPTAPSINGGTGSGAGNSLALIAQNAGGTNDGGAVILGGGAHAGSGTVDGSTKITTPWNPGFLSYTFPSDANQTFTATQSDANFVIINNGTITIGRSITLTRRAADTSCFFVRNNNAQSVSFAFLTGSGVSVATNTSALICSDGTNAQKIMAGT